MSIIKYNRNFLANTQKKTRTHICFLISCLLQMEIIHYGEKNMSSPRSNIVTLPSSYYKEVKEILDAIHSTISLNEASKHFKPIVAAKNEVDSLQRNENNKTD